MKLKQTFAALLLCTAATLPAQNLIQNAEFDKPLDAECRLDAAPGVCKTGIFTEDLTWNKCLKLEVAKHVTNKDGKTYYARVLVGGGKNENGFKVKSNTIYSYTMELKGNIGVAVVAMEWTGANYWKDCKRLKVTGDAGSKPSKEWTVIRGTFQTGANATHAAIGVNIWGEERYKNLPPLGGFILLDKVKVEEKADLLGGLKKKLTPVPILPLKKVLIPGKSITGFVDYKSGEKAKADTVVGAECGEKSIKLKITCLEPEMGNLKSTVAADGGNVWKDDVVEIFFGTFSGDRALTQFVVSAGGGRWMGHGSDKNVNEYGKWTAEVTKEKDAWGVEAEIPYTLLGWKERPGKGSSIAFNVARDRKSVRELTSWSFANGSFHNMNNFGVLLLDTPEVWFAETKSKLQTEAASLNDNALSAKIGAWKQAGKVPEIIRQAEMFRKEISVKKLGNRTFVLTEINPAMEPTIPMLPGNLAEVPEKISIRAAGNEFKALPLVITNLLDRPEEYRVVIAAPGMKKYDEEKSIKDSSGNFFPPEKIRLYRGVRIKDGDEKKHGLRFDPLAPMDTTSTVVVMPDEGTPVWAIFDTTGVKPAKYTGVIRVIPLGQAAEIDPKNNEYRGNMLSLPFEFEVLPFELSKAPPIPQFYFGEAYKNEEVFRMMLEHGVNVPLVNTWGVRVSFNPDGSVKKRDTVRVEKEILLLREWAKKYGMEKDIRIGVAYAAYILFRDVHAKKQFKYGTPEWEKAWRNYVLILEDVRKKCGVPNSDFFVEIHDEPHVKDMPELIAASKIAHEAAPSLNFMITLASWEIPLTELEKLVPYLSHWCFWSTKYFNGKENTAFQKELRAKGRNISFYVCETTMRLDLQNYYLTHPWRALAHDLDMCNFFQFLTYQYATRDWKTGSFGNVALMSGGHPVSTIRLECLRIGNTDVKYMKKLAEVLKSSKQGDEKLRAEAETFLKTMPRVVGLEMTHDATLPSKTREKAIDFILQLMK